MARIACFLLVLSCGALAQAQQVKVLRYDVRLDLSLTLGAVTLWGTAYLLEDQLVPARCRWCDDNGFDARARDALRWTVPRPAGVLSDVGALVAMPMLSFAGLALAANEEGAARYVWQDALFVFEAISAAALLNVAIKFAVARERPYAHHDTFDGQPRGSFERTSFYSGHSSRSFALASAAGMVASLRGYRSAPWIWTLGMLTATAVAYARVAGDYHYLSDVLVGAALGSLVGAGLPWLLHRPGATFSSRGGGRLGQLSVSALGIAWTLRH